MKLTKLLILEDSPDDAALIRATLSRSGLNFDVSVVSTRRDFIAALDSFVPEIILSDHRLPQFTSNEALGMSRKKFPFIPFILITGAVSDEFAASIIKEGADDYFLKGNLKRLPTAIEQAIKKKEIEKERLRLSLIIDATSDFVGIAGMDQKVLYLNKAGREITGYGETEDLSAKLISEFSPAWANKIVSEKSIPAAIENGKWTGEFAILDRSGADIPVSAVVIVHKSPDGQPQFVSTIARDITERIRSEQQKEFDRNNLSALINNTNDLMWSIDRDMNLITCNDSFNKIIEITSGKLLMKGESVLSIQFTPEQLERYKEFYGRALSGETFTIVDHFKHPFEFWSEISFYPITQDGKVIGTACFSKDITERKKAEENLKLLEAEILEQRIQQQKKIARAIITGQEKERNYIGQELHDNINQILAGTKMFLAIAGKKSEEAKEIVKYPMELIDSSIEEIRLLCSKLVTPVKNINLEELIRDLLTKIDQNEKTKTLLIYEVPAGLLSDDLKLNIYRIIQEQINNIMKYAEAGNVNISIQAKDKTISVNVTDDGKGFEVKAKRQGIGISNMINRAETFNGKVKIKSSPGKGCKTTVTIPY